MLMNSVEIAVENDISRLVNNLLSRIPKEYHNFFLNFFLSIFTNNHYNSEYKYFNIQEQIIISMMLEGHSREGTNASPFHDSATIFRKNVETGAIGSYGIVILKSLDQLLQNIFHMS